MMIDLCISWAILYLTAFSFGLSFHSCGSFVAAFATIILLGPAVASFADGHLFLATVAAVVLGSAIGFCYHLLFAPKTPEHSPPQRAQMLLASFGLHLALTNIIILLSGDNRIFLPTPTTVVLSGYKVSAVQVVLFSSALAVSLAWQLSRLLPLGLRTRAVFNNPALAESFAVSIRTYRMILGAISGAAFAMLGIGLSMETGVSPYTTISVLFMGAIAYIVNGRKSLDRLEYTCLLLTLVLAASTHTIGGAWRESTLLLVLICVLELRRLPPLLAGKKITPIDRFIGRIRRQ